MLIDRNKYTMRCYCGLDLREQLLKTKETWYNEYKFKLSQPKIIMQRLKSLSRCIEHQFCILV